MLRWLGGHWLDWVGSWTDIMDFARGICAQSHVQGCCPAETPAAPLSPLRSAVCLPPQGFLLVSEMGGMICFRFFKILAYSLMT